MLLSRNFLILMHDHLHPHLFPHFSKGNITINFITVVLMEYFLFSAKIWIESSNGAKMIVEKKTLPFAQVKLERLVTSFKPVGYRV